MGWVYDRLQRAAFHDGLGVVFSVAPPGPDGGEVALRLKAGSTSRWSEKDWADHRGAIARAVEDEHARLEMCDLLRSGVFGGLYASAARAIEQQTGKRVGERTIQAWVAEPDKKSSRRCPAWALKALRDHIAREGPKQAESGMSPLPPRPWAMEVADKHALKFAEDRLLHEQRVRDKWRGAKLEDFADLLADLEIKVERWLWHSNASVTDIASAAEAGKDFGEFKARLKEKRDEKFFIEATIGDARAELEAGRLDLPDEDVSPR